MEEEIQQLKLSDDLIVRVGQFWRIGRFSLYHLNNPTHELTSIHKDPRGGFYICFEWEDRNNGETAPVSETSFLDSFNKGECTLRRDILHTKLDLKLNPNY